ncbi:hypothetical protein F4803DRAFT_499220 [Xylaria telfairii]|nr:hypothetical protein F4803DRAFT_499220 [Xylaria telfairii]
MYRWTEMHLPIRYAIVCCAVLCCAVPCCAGVSLTYVSWFQANASSAVGVLDGSQLPRFVSSRMGSPSLSVHARHMIPDMGDKDKTAGYSMVSLLMICGSPSRSETRFSH